MLLWLQRECECMPAYIQGDVPITCFHSEHRSVARPTVVTTSKTATRGRPRKAIAENYLQKAFAPCQRLTIQTLAQALGVHRNMLHKHIQYHRISKKFTPISNTELDAILCAYKQHKPTSGLRYAMGFLRAASLRIQRECICQSLLRVDGLGQVLHQHKAIRRRKYTVPRSNALWHCDGHHKLIWRGIVIHGFVDGRDRTVSLAPHFYH